MNFETLLDAQEYNKVDKANIINKNNGLKNLLIFHLFLNIK